MLSIIIASHDRKKEIISNLQIMKKNNVFKGIDSKVILIFDGNTVSDLERELIKSANPCNQNLEIINFSEHKGQNYVRNIGINKSKEFCTKLILFLDDDAYIKSNEELLKAIGIINFNSKIGALGLNVIKTSNMQPQYYNNCIKRDDIFSVLFPCLAGTLIKSSIVYNYKKFFFPEEIYYGADEWALATRVRQLGFQVYATEICKVFHNIIGGGRSKDIRFKYQYAHSYIWTITLSKRQLFILTFIRIISLIKTSLSKEERKYFKQKISGLFCGIKDGYKNKNLDFNKYELYVKNREIFSELLSDSFSMRSGYINKIISKII
ncbi:hypothetical protein KCL46_003067 [Clostridium perfringens]|nr:hypothetical protein [Clostridium perfringens]EHK2442952.1 hypothetical protein [Clostridium perfringens]